VAIEVNYGGRAVKTTGLPDLEIGNHPELRGTPGLGKFIAARQSQALTPDPGGFVNEDTRMQHRVAW
jgi:hypothetical protein